MQPHDRQVLEHILDYCNDIEECISRFGRDLVVFSDDKAYHDLISFYILQIGELSVRLSAELRAASADMNWAQMKGMRNIVAHHYGSLKLDILWKTAVSDIPALKAFCLRQLEQ